MKAARSHTPTLNTHACFLSAGCGKHGEGNSPSAVQTWPPITLPCGGIMWQAVRPARLHNRFCTECKVNNIIESNSHLPLRIRKGATTGLAADFLYKIMLQLPSRGTLKSNSVKQKTEWRDGECGLHSGTAM